LKVIRDGQTKNFNVTLGELPPDKNEEAPASENSGSALDGVQVQTLNSDTAEQLNLPASTHGVVITSVDPSSAAAEAGLSRGDVVQEVNHKPVSNTHEFEQAVQSSGKGPVLLLVNHGGVTAYVAIEGR
jgi:serine protease Do